MTRHADPDVIDDDDPPEETERPALARLVAPLRPLAPKVAAVIRPPPERLAADRRRNRPPPPPRPEASPCAVPHCSGTVLPGYRGRAALAPLCPRCRDTVRRSVGLGWSIEVALARKMRGARPGDPLLPEEGGVPEVPRSPCAMPGCRTLCPKTSKHAEVAGLCQTHRDAARLRAYSGREGAAWGGVDTTNLAAIVADMIRRAEAKRDDLRAWASRGASNAAE